MYVVITVCLRLMGKRQVGELQSSELVITLLVSELASIPLQEPGIPLLSGIIPILALVICELGVSALMVKWRWFRRILCGSPVAVIQNGQIDPKQLRRLRLTIEDLTEQLRLQNVFDIHEVAFAAVEPNGQLSVLKKPDFTPPDAQALGVQNEVSFSTVVICDGAFCPQSARLCGRSPGWVRDVLRREKCAQQDVFLLTADLQGGYTLLRRSEVLRH